VTILDRNSGVFNTTTAFNVTRSTGTFGTGTVIVIAVFGNTIISTPSGATLRATSVSNLGLYAYDIAGAGQSSIAVTASPAGSGVWYCWELSSGSTWLTGNASELGAATSFNLSVTPTAGSRHVLATAGGLGSGLVRSVTAFSNSFGLFGAAQAAAQDWPFAGGADLDTTASGAAITTTATFSASAGVVGGIVLAYINNPAAPAPAPPRRPAIVRQAVGTASTW
jgi:hypothetical protein